MDMLTLLNSAQVQTFGIYLLLLAVQILLLVLALVKKRDVFWISLFAVILGSAALVMIRDDGFAGAYAFLAYAALFYGSLTKRALLTHNAPHKGFWTAFFLLSTVGVMFVMAGVKIWEYAM